MGKFAIVFGLLALIPGALAHTGHERGLDEQLVQSGEKLLLGNFDAPQPGPLVVVPYTEGVLPCGPSPQTDYLIQLGPDAGVTFMSNATHVVAVFDLPGDGWTVWAADTHAAHRALIVMTEQAIAEHRLAAWGRDPANASRTPVRGGVLGIPYELPGASMHSFSHGDVDDAGIYVGYDADPGPASVCRSSPGQLTLALERAAAPEALVIGRIVHVVAMYDARIPQFLLRPVESTQILQANLYLARPGEDPADVRAAFEPKPGPGEVAPLAGLVAGLGWAVTRRR